MNYKIIDVETWDRKENYIWFTEHMELKMNMTTNIDITNLIKEIKRLKLRCYPVFTYISSRIVNENDELRITHNKDKQVILYDTLHARYPIFHENEKKISILWTEYNKDFNIFYKSFIKDVEDHKDIISMSAKSECPPNIFDMSCIPWTSFTSFSSFSTNDGRLCVPFILVGKFFQQNDKTMLPVNISVHHATCDGYHISNFFNQFQDLAYNYKDWLNIE